MALLLIILLWQIIPTVYYAFKNNDKKIKNYILFAGIYFIINLIIMLLTYPAMSMNDGLASDYNFANNYSIYWSSCFAVNYLENVFHNIFPVYIGGSICIVILYSLGFSYIINKFREICPHSFWLLFIPFCFPCVLLLNGSLDRNYVIGNLMVFLMAYIFLNINKKNNNLIVCILLSILTGFISILRSEYIILILFIPLLLYLCKVLSKNKILILFVISCAFFSFNNWIQHLPYGYSFDYELHNMSFVYKAYNENKYYDKDIEKNIDLLNKFYNYDGSAKYNFGKYEIKEAKKCTFVLMKFALLNSKYFIKHYIHVDLNYNIFYFPERIIRGLENPELMKLNDFFNPNNIKYKNTCYFLYGSTDNCGDKNIELKNKFLKTIYNFQVCFGLLLMMFMYALLKRKTFFIFYFIIWSLVLLIILSFSYVRAWFYYYAFILNVWTFFFILLSMCFNSLYAKSEVKN